MKVKEDEDKVRKFERKLEEETAVRFRKDYDKVRESFK